MVSAGMAGAGGVDGKVVKKRDETFIVHLLLLFISNIVLGICRHHKGSPPTSPNDHGQTHISLSASQSLLPDTFLLLQLPGLPPANQLDLPCLFSYFEDPQLALGQ